KNQLLAELLANPQTRDYLRPHLKIVTIEHNQVLYEQGDPIEFVYFPIDSVISSLVIMEDGTTLETLMIGRDGFVGVSAILGSGVSRNWLWTLISGTAIQVETRFLDTVFVRNENALKALL